MCQKRGNYKKYTSNNPLISMVISGFLKEINTAYNTINAKTMLDVGCGEGFVLNYLNPENSTGVDISRDALSFARKTNKGSNFYMSSVFNLPFKDESFDVVLALEVLEHLQDPVSALNEIKRVTKKYCIFSVPNEPYFRMMNMLRGKNITRFGNDIEHVQSWSSKQFTYLVSSYFNVLNVKKPFPWTIVICKK